MGDSGKLTKESIYREIEQIRSEILADRNLRIRAQMEIFKRLEEALNCLEESESESALNKAAFKVALARSRHMQANNQKMWLSIVICTWGMMTLAVSVFAIIQWGL